MYKYIDSQPETVNIALLTLTENQRDKMENEQDVFKYYLKEKKTFSQLIRQPKFWLIVVVMLVGAFLAFQFFLTSIKNLSTEELKASIDIVWHEARWVNKDVSPYGVTIVPSIVLKIKNIGTKPLKYVKFIGIFLFEENNKQLSDGFISVFRKALSPGETSEEIFIKAFNGYKAKSKESFFRNKKGWKKVKVKVFAGTSSTPALLGVFPVKQEIEGLKTDDITEEQSGDSEKRYLTEELRKSIQIVWSDSYWIYKKYSTEGIIVVPFIKIKVKNLGTTPLRHISFRGNFQLVSSGKPFSQGITIGLEELLSPEKISEEIHISGEYGYSVSSMEALERNKTMMEKLKVRVMAKTKVCDEVLLGIFPVNGIIKAEKK